MLQGLQACILLVQLPTQPGCRAAVLRTITSVLLPPRLAPVPLRTRARCVLPSAPRPHSYVGTARSLLRLYLSHPQAVLQ